MDTPKVLTPQLEDLVSKCQAALLSTNAAAETAIKAAETAIEMGSTNTPNDYALNEMLVQVASDISDIYAATGKALLAAEAALIVSCSDQSRCAPKPRTVGPAF
jgi:hypothetical protein